MDKKVFLQKYSNSTGRNTVAGLTVNNGNSDYAILYDDFSEPYYGYQSGYDEYAPVQNVPAKVIISNNAHNAVVAYDNMPKVEGKDVYGRLGNNEGYSINDGTKILHMPAKLGNPMNTTVKANWMKNKLPQGAQTSFMQYFQKNSSNQLTDNPKDGNTNNAIKKLLNEYN